MFKSLVKVLDEAGRDLDKALGNPSHLNSSIPEKRKAKENEYKDVAHVLTGGAAYPEKRQVTEESDEMMVVPTTVTEEVKKEAVLVTEAEEMIQTDLSLKLGMLTYIERNKLDISPAVTTAIANAASSTEVVEELAPLDNPVLNAQMLHWAIHNSSSDHTAKDLKTVVFAHLAEVIITKHYLVY